MSADARPLQRAAAGALVSNARKKLNIRQQDLAQAMVERGYNWTRGTVARIETGRRSLLLEEGCELCIVLQVGYQSLFEAVIDYSASRLRRRTEPIPTEILRRLPPSRSRAG